VLKAELIVPHAVPLARVPLMSKVRGTVLLASVRALRSRGYGDAYLALLPPRFHEAIQTLNAVTWLPGELAMAHYEACDRLALARPTIEAIGAESGIFVNQTLLSLVGKVSKESGVTPWFPLSQAGKLRERAWVGSSMAVWKIGPKEARLDWVQQPVMRFPYLRMAFAAFAQAICSLFAMTVYVREIPSRTTETETSYRISWV
jgi:hypothetical protein